MKKFLLWQPLIKRWSSNVKGFSLLELMIVVALVASLFFLGATHTHLFDRFFVRSELDKFYAMCTYVQQVALVCGKEQVIELYPQEGRYCYKGSTQTLPSSVLFATLQNVLGPPSLPTKPLTQASTFIDNKIVFSPEGMISSGVVYITDRAKQCQYAISSGISHISYLRKYEYTNGRWHSL